MVKTYYTDIVKLRKKVQSKQMRLVDLLRVKYSKDNKRKEQILNDTIISKYYFDTLDKNIFTENFSNYFDNQYFYYREKSDLETELIWNCLILKKFSSELSKYNAYRLKYEKYLFKDDFNNAKIQLEQIEREFGVSLWLVENKMLLEEFYSENSKMNIENITKEYSKEGTNFQKYLMDKISERITDDFSFDKYSKRTSMEIENSQLPFEIKLFCVYWLDYHNFLIDDEALSSVLVISFNTSLIDRYNLTIRILQQLIAEKKHEKLLNNCLRLLSDIKDLRIDKINAIYMKDNELLQLSKTDQLFNSVLDEYTIGNYQTALEKLPEVFEQNAGAFKILDIYNKSLLLSDLIPNKTKEIFKANFLKEISNAYFEVLTKSELYLESIKKILVFSRKLGANDWAIQMYYSIYTQFNNVNLKEKETYIFLNSPINTVNDAIFIINDNARKNYILQFGSDSNTLRLWKFYNTNEIEFDLKDIPYYRILTYEAKREQKIKRTGFQSLTKRLDDEIKKISSIDKSRELSSLNYFKEKMRHELYSMLLADENYTDSVDLVVENYLENSINLRMFNTEYLLNEIEKGTKNKLITSKIETLIFMKLEDSSKLSYFFELFLDCKNINKPTELIIEDFSVDKVIFFFEEVCNIGVLSDQVLIFDRHEEVEIERLNILRKLIGINPSDERIYTEEISRISQDKLLRELIQKVNQSKLFVDVNRIWEEKKDSIIESIHKFLEADTQKMRYYNLNKKEVLLEDMGKLDNEEIFYFIFETPKEKELRNVLNEILDFFLSNNEYGLDTYLSTRIRHGTLQGQLRSPFQKNNLITTRKSDKSDEYIANDIMLKRINGNAKSINKIFSDFSYKIDSLIEDVKKNWMQIKINGKNPQGMFDFDDLDLSFEELYSNVSSESSPKIIFELIIQHLWDETEKSLERIRERLKKELCDQFIELLTKLQEDLANEQTGDNTFVNRKISECKTDVQLSIDEVSSWFERVDPSDDMKVTSFELLELCKRIRVNISPEFSNVNFVSNGDEQILLSGRELPYYVDILLILIDNSIKHSSLELEELNVEMYIENTENGNIKITVSNNFNNNILNEISKSIEVIKDKLSSSKKQSSELVKVEGGSGYLKIFKVIKYDLEAKPIIDVSQKDNIFFSQIEIGR